MNNESIHVIEEQDERPINLEDLRDKCVISEFNTGSANGYQEAMRFVISNGSAKNSKNKKLTTIQHCIDYFLQEEKLDEDNAWYCPKCKDHKQASKKVDIYKMPKILIVQLKRFGTTRSAYTSRRKVKDLIKFPLDDLDFTDYHFGPFDKKTEKPVYTLTGVSNHSGEMGFGHYTAYGRSVRDGKWYMFDDSRVSEVRDPESVCSSAGYVFLGVW